MTQEQKDILIKDLCARLPYGVKVQVDLQSDIYSPIVCKVSSVECVEIGSTFIGVETSPDTYNEFREFLCKPYLFPLPSMTEEQRIELYKVLGLGYESHYHLSKEWEDFNNSIDNNGLFLPASWVSDLNKMYNWLNKNHFDYQGLIPMGLAEDATGKNIY